MNVKLCRVAGKLGAYCTTEFSNTSSPVSEGPIRGWSAHFNDSRCLLRYIQIFHDSSTLLKSSSNDCAATFTSCRLASANISACTKIIAAVPSPTPCHNAYIVDEKTAREFKPNMGQSECKTEISLLTIISPFQPFTNH